MSSKIMLYFQDDISYKINMNKIKLYKKTLNLLQRTRIPVSQIAKDTKLKPRWLNMVKNDEIPDPGVKKIEKVYDYLKK